MLALMMTPALLVRIWAATTGRPTNVRPAAAVGLALLFSFTASGHFIQTDAMALMLPAWVPARVALVYLTGLLEIAIAVAFFVPRYRKMAGWVAMAVLVIFFPANIYAAIERVPMGGHAWGPAYLLIRAPLQLAILWWVYRFTVRPAQPVVSLRDDASYAQDVTRAAPRRSPRGPRMPDHCST